MAGNTGNRGGQYGNKNAEKWLEPQAIEIGQSLIDWLKESEMNVLFKYFLYVENDYDYYIIEYLGRKFESFLELIKRAREIQKIKLQHLGLNKKVDSTQSIWLSRINHGVTEDGEKDLFEFEKQAIAKDNSRFITKSTQITNVYLRTIEAVEKGYRVIDNKGSSRSSKTKSLIDIHIDWLYTGLMGTRQISGNAAVFQKSLPYLKKNLLEDILKTIRERKISIGSDIEWNQSGGYFRVQDRKWFYSSLNNESEVDKAKGWELGSIWFNEAHDIKYSAFKQLNMRAANNPIFFLDHNPEDENSWVKTEIEDTRSQLIGDVCIIHSTYNDNRFLPESTVKEIENFKLTDPDWFNIYGLGQYGKLKGRIYDIAGEYSELPRARYITFYGQDFGYSNSKDAVLEINWKRNSNDLYVKSRLYKTGLLPNELTKAVKEIVADGTLFADCEDARMIGDERAAGINVLKPKKGKLRGINLVKGFNIHIHIESIDLQKELKSYRWQKDPNNDDKFLNVPMEGHGIHEHLIKCLEYGAMGAVDTKLIPQPNRIK